MEKRVEFLKKMREVSHKGCFEKFLESLDPEDVKTIRKETLGVLHFMKIRDVAFEDFPDLLENRLRIVWNMNWE